MSSIFLSHNSKDKPFVRKLASDLRSQGFYVWVDEAEIKLGDSLIEKIRDGLDRVEYVGVVLSNNSINSQWVKKEIDIAMNQEIEDKKIKVLPLMLEKVEPPYFLKGKLYADFTSEEKYASGLQMVISRLSENPNTDQEKTQSSIDIEETLKRLKQLEEELNVTKTDRRLLLERLEKERRSIPDRLKEAIQKEERYYPELSDINKYYAFDCAGTPITAGYVLHDLRKELIKGGPHQIALLCHIENKTDELSILIEAIMRRMNNL